MTPYRNLGMNSGIIGYELGDDYIRVQFSSGAIYQYSYAKAGVQHVQTTKQIAMQGYGLDSYINRHVRKLYDDF